MNGPTNRRLIRRVLTVSVFACLTLIAAAPMASADPCSPLDLSCTLQDTTTTAGQVLEDTTTTAGQVLDDTTTTAGQVLDDTTATAGQVLDDTTTTVGQVLDDTTATVGGVVGGGRGPVGGGLPVSRRRPAEVNRRKVARILLPISPSPPAAARPAVAMNDTDRAIGTGTHAEPSALPSRPGSSPQHRSGSGDVAGITGRTTSASWTAARVRCYPARGSRGRSHSPVPDHARDRLRPRAE